MTLDIAIETDAEWDSSTDWPGLVRKAAESALSQSAFPQLTSSPRNIELSVRLTGDEAVRQLNARWRGKDEATNILSFPLAEAEQLQRAAEPGPELMLGDLVLAHGVCVREAADKRIAVERHAAHLLVHGVLHLVGHDHQDDMSADEMERRETLALADLGIPDPYLEER